MKRNLWCKVCKARKELGILQPNGQPGCQECGGEIVAIRDVFGTGPRDRELNQFINDRCWEGFDCRSPRKALLEAYRQWGGHRSFLALGHALHRAMFFTTGGKHRYIGLELRT